MAVKEINVQVTQKQHASIRKAAVVAGQSMSEFIRSILIQHGVIEYEEIKHGGYRERSEKPKTRL